MVSAMPKMIDFGKVKDPELRVKEYSRFKGVDFSTDPTQVADGRSPYAVNLISDLAGFPEKRAGWRTLHQSEGAVNGLFYAVINDVARFIAHIGTKLYLWTDDTLTEIAGTMADAKSSAFAHGGKLYLLDGAKYQVLTDVDGVLTLTSVADGECFVPTTVIGAKPDGSGTAFEAVNLLTPKRINSFAGDGETKEYHLDATELDETPITATVEGEEKTEVNGFSVDREKGVVTFDTAPPVYAGGSGIDNVVIHFSKTVEGYADKINKCSFFAHYGYNNDNRLFFSGNPDSKNTDWQSGLDDPTYFPDTGYTNVGTDNTAIMGYLKQYENLLVIKEDNEQDAEIFLRTAGLDANNTVYFPLAQGVKGVGAISRHAFATLRDDPLFLTREGVYSVVSSTVTQQRATQNRSYFVDARLRTEQGLKDAVSVVWNDLYVLCVNGHCYVADSRQKSTVGESFGYEWYLWNNIPARVFLEHDGALYFGTADGRICKFNTDVATMARYNDDGQPIVARWSTKADDFGSFMVRKTMTKRGSGVMIKPYTRSSVRVYAATEAGIEKAIRYGTMDIFSFADIDFGRFAFNTSDSPQVIPFNKKLKKFITLQIVLENNTLDEGFGVYGVIVQYVTGNYVKK